VTRAADLDLWRAGLGGPSDHGLHACDLKAARFHPANAGQAADGGVDDLAAGKKTIIICRK